MSWVRQLRALDVAVGRKIRTVEGSEAWLLLARGLAALGVIYALALASVLAVGAADGLDATSAAWTALALPWCAVPLLWIVRGRYGIAVVVAAIVLPVVQVALFLPAYGFGAYYLPILLTAWLLGGLLSVSALRQRRRAARCR